MSVAVTLFFVDLDGIAISVLTCSSNVIFSESPGYETEYQNQDNHNYIESDHRGVTVYFHNRDVFFFCILTNVALKL